MKKTLLTLVLLLAASGMAQAQDPFDLNKDGDVNVGDVTTLINRILGKDKPEPGEADAAVEAGLCPNANHPHIINMGEAGKWACCNVGATNPFEFGGYYAWGETEEKFSYLYTDYNFWHDKDADGNANPYEFDNLGDISGSKSYDVASVKWGGAWKMPTYHSIESLVYDCSSKWTTLNGVEGEVFTAPNGNSLFLPAAGTRYGVDLIYTNGGYYWSSTPDNTDRDCAYYLGFDSYATYITNYYRDRTYGLSVRPVAEGQDPFDLNQDGDVNVGDVTTLINHILGKDKPEPAEADAAVEAGLCPDKNHPHAIDMGAAGKWACCNVGAANPFEDGGYYAWGETEEKEDYTDNNYIYIKNGLYADLGDISGNKQYDVATAQWGEAWKMPESDRIQQLLDYCPYEFTTLNDVSGGVFTAKNGNRIFLPASGFRYGTALKDAGSLGTYWSSTPHSEYIPCAFNLYFNSDDPWGDGASVSYGDRFNGHTVRPVAE